MSDKSISIDLREVIEMLEQIDPLVVSLDRIGSHFAGNKEGEADVLNQFSLEFDLAGRLSVVRKILLESLHDQLNREELIKIEEELERLVGWERQ